MKFGLSKIRSVLLLMILAGTSCNSEPENYYTFTTGVQDIAWSGSQYMLVGSFGTIITSPDANNWNIQDSRTNESFSSVIWDGTRFIAATANMNGYRGSIYSSPDGVQWTMQWHANGKIRDIIKNGTTYYILTDDGLFYSTDLVTWYAAGNPLIEGSQLLWNGVQYIVIGRNGSISTSPDAFTWTAQTSGTRLVLYSIAWNGTAYVIVGENGIILTSSDGVNWTAQSSGTEKYHLSDVIWSGTQYIAVGYPGTILTSSDGVTWTVQNSHTLKPLPSVIWDGTRYVVAGSDAILTSPDGVNWTLNDFGWWP